MTNNRVNFTERHVNGGWAKYLPAISGFYTTHLGKALSDENFVPKERVPAGFELGLQGIDFLKPPGEAYYSYKYGLFSAGHAERNLTKCDDREPMIHKRDKDTVIVGDSGGFQIATGVIKLDWATVKTPAGDKLREEILRFLEHTSDWSMTLDVPPIAATYPMNLKTGLQTFEECMDVTMYNLDYFIRNRVPGKTKFLNVISGTNPENSKIWYDKVTPYSVPDVVEALGIPRSHTLEGWAFAGVNMRDMKTTLARLLNLRDDGLLEGKDWIHFLGVGRLDWACFLTSIERVLRRYHNPNINISFDAASPFVAAGGYALMYDYNYFKSDQLTYSMNRGIDNKDLKGSKAGMPYQGPIMERLTAGDICYMGHGDLNKHGKEGKTSWDTTSYAMVMAHNVYNHIQGVQEINRLADIDYATRPATGRDYTMWHKDFGKKRRLSEYVPNSIIFFNDFVERLFDPANKDPYTMLKDAKPFLDSISFGDIRTVTTALDLFDFDAVSKNHTPTVQDMASLDNEDLIDIDEKT